MLLDAVFDQSAIIQGAQSDDEGLRPGRAGLPKPGFENADSLYENAQQ
ncbi:hypothetical protein [Methylocystis hirsuta]|nr:hypothetical protein [Methylocystis hirsuta]